MTLSVDELRMSVIFIAKATSNSEWWNTAIHELKHTADAIITHYNVEWDSEDAAYLTGFLTKELVKLVGKTLFLNPTIACFVSCGYFIHQTPYIALERDYTRNRAIF